MAETVKKSRIVSDDDLEETLMEEFNLRLKSCLSQDPLDVNEELLEPENVYENIETIKTSTEYCATKSISHSFIETEKREQFQNETTIVMKNGNHDMSNGHTVSTTEENIYENVPKMSSDYVDMDRNVVDTNGSSNNTETIYEDLQSADQMDRTEHEAKDTVLEDLTESVRQKPSFTLLSAVSIDTPEKLELKSAKDRMLLASDDTSTLLFTQTVTSPMLTPSEENVDFLKGFRRESSPNSSPKDGSRSEESPRINEKSSGKDLLVQDGDSEVIEDIEADQSTPSAAKLVNQVQGDIYENLETMDECIYENVGEARKGIADDCFNNRLDKSQENSACLDDSEPISEDVPEIVSQIEQRKTSEYGEEDDVTEISDVCSLDKQVSDSDSSNLMLDSSKADDQEYERVSDKFGVVQAFIEGERIVEAETIEMNEADNMVGDNNIEQIRKTGYDDSEVLEYIAMTEEPRNAPTVLGDKYPLDDNQFDTDSGIDTKPNESGDYDMVHDKEEEYNIKDINKQRPASQMRIVDEIVKNYVTTKSDTNLKNREKDTETVPAKIVQNLTSQFMKTGDDKEEAVKNKKHDANQLKSVDIMKQINKFEHKDEDCDKEKFNPSSPIGRENSDKKSELSFLRSSSQNLAIMKSSFSKFDALQKKNVLHIRSTDSTKAQEKFNGTAVDTTQCKCCGKQVFQMEQIKAEKAIWHKNCFRCHECNKQLTVDTYESHEGSLYCKPHFKALFAPKVVDDTDEPPSDKPDLGLEELQSLNVKERFQVFEHYQSNDNTVEKAQINVKRSPSILSKLAKFQSKGMDVGVADDSLNGIPIEESSSEEEEEEEIPEGEDPDLVRAKRVQKEKPFHFSGMSDVKSRWEHGEPNARDERREERKQEIQSIRNKLFMGKQGKMKEAYQEAVMKSESTVNMKKEEIKVCDTKTIKERFEKGEVVQETNRDDRDEDEQEVYESEISKKSRSLFLQLDANASKPPQMSPISPPRLEVKKAREGSTLEREVYHDPDVAREEEVVEDSVIAKETHTATKMLNKFRQMEENLAKEPTPQGPKPLKRFTPPPEPSKDEESSSEEGSESEEEEEQLDATKMPDDDLLEAQKAARAKQLRAKFEKWEAQEIKREQHTGSINIIEEYGEEQSQIESTKLLRARFESMRDSHSDVNKQPRIKVNRFVLKDIQVNYSVQKAKEMFQNLQAAST